MAKWRDDNIEYILVSHVWIWSNNNGNRGGNYVSNNGANILWRLRCDKENKIMENEEVHAPGCDCEEDGDDAEGGCNLRAGGKERLLGEW